MDTQNKINPAIAALIVIILIGVSTAGVALLNNSQNESTSTTSQPQSATTSNDSHSNVRASSFMDGQYEAEGSYSTPGGTQSIGLTVTLKNGIIEDVNLDQHARSGESVEYQAKFASGYKTLVQGKKIDEVQLTRVAGSSLTSGGFNDALDQIERDAAA